MSDTSAPQDAAPASAPAGPPLRILGQFIKDFSFEVPNAPEIFQLLRQQGPEIPVSMDTSARQLEGSPTFEVTITMHLEATLAGKKAFILELTYCSIVELVPQVVPEEHVHPLLLIEVPRQMFPFVRQIVTDATVNGGFPPLILQIFDFGELYRKKFAATAAAGEPSAPPQPSVH